MDVRKGKGFGYQTDDGRLCMIRCFECGRENYGLAVATGCCAKCGHDANAEKENGPNKVESVSKDQDNPSGD